MNDGVARVEDGPFAPDVILQMLRAGAAGERSDLGANVQRAEGQEVTNQRGAVPSSRSDLRAKRHLLGGPLNPFSARFLSR